MGMTDDEIRAAWAKFGANSASWADWRRNYLAAVTLATGSDDTTFVRTDTQRRLWTADDAMSAGLGRSVNTDTAQSNEALLDALVALRRAPLPPDDVQRGRRLQDEYEKLLGLVKQAGVKRMPRAKMLRYLALVLPAEFTCLLNDLAFEKVRDLLLDGTPTAGRADVHVRIRARLRAVLGPESTAADHVDRSIFCWWLYSPLREVAPPPQPPVVLWAFEDQYKGLAAVSGYGDFVREVVREARTAQTAADLFVAWCTRTGDTSIRESLFASRLSLVRGLGFLQRNSDGTNVATPDGIAILDDDDLLIRRLLERVFGMGHLLAELRDTANGLSRDELNHRLQTLYPAWTTGFATGGLRRWLQNLGLVEQRERRWFLTDDGRSWLARITSLPMPPGHGAGPSNGTDGAQKPSVWTFAAVRAQMTDARFVDDEPQLRALHAAWRAHDRKHFVLLSGLSGTGKTQLALRYGRAVCAVLGLDAEQHIALVPVSPEWHDPTAVLGYLNPLRGEPSFHAGPVLPLLLHAAAHPSLPHFLVLDEMNLAPAERYFAPFLSAMETGEAIPLHHEPDEIGGVPAEVLWPSNLYIAGTVNMDETTHSFSDKVLDRAFTLEFWDVNLHALFETLRSTHDLPAFSVVCEALLAFQHALAPVQRHFGYRSAREVVEFVLTGVRDTGGDAGEFLDAAVFGKVLPRLRGDDNASMRSALQQAREAARRFRLPRTERKLEAMVAQLDRTGLTKFHA